MSISFCTPDEIPDRCRFCDGINGATSDGTSSDVLDILALSAHNAIGSLPFLQRGNDKTSIVGSDDTE
jgi:hypothetical protein